ncbi:S24 family peptidase [Duffyella gerundensis]|uniref:S24 family peptidase n=1 Tax=Duffyella gerundensis TaxID=1619313 RepID=UPI001654A0F9|nr:S24 family peptidase [Duffyella gerundensis]
MAFQNPAQNFAEQRLNLGDLVTLSPHSTFIVRSDAHYPEAGIMKGSVLAIDRAITPQHQHIIVAEIDGELALRRLLLTPVAAIQELSGDETVTLLDETQELPVWGVVAYALNDIAGLGFTSPSNE